MRTIQAEFTKLKRSLGWAIVLLLPLVMVISGSIMTLVDGRPLEDGWHTLWMRSIVFYGLFPLAVGVAILGSLVWRVEHRGSNWNALMSGPTPSLYIVAAKTTVIAIMTTLMQVVALITVILVGKLAFGLPGLLPAKYVFATVLVMLACIPVAALQSGMSMLMRSFAAPIAIAFLGAGVSTFLLVLRIDPVIFISPYALISRTTQLGTGTFADTGYITAPIVSSIIIATGLLTAVAMAISALILERTDTRT
ncbi:MAG: ABC transporter permease [Brevibacterium aurantiacum]|uniref:ABC transporter n=1 Tax=Brevibacterium aurantiacum TaxID=273384 RepID=A0A3Q9NTG8_BREAU|nr:MULTISPECIES: ABC transporter permease [Micrococcales]AZT94760.1 ABC transporter [Brevibacterium aurantiacum]MDN5605547.1 ABC transporter permease [Kocuria sp.]RCS82598.1 ABC transporter [Brachybacterium alimentarium]